METPPPSPRNDDSPLPSPIIDLGFDLGINMLLDGVWRGCIDHRDNQPDGMCAISLNLNYSLQVFKTQYTFEARIIF